MIQNIIGVDPASGPKGSASILIDLHAGKMLLFQKGQVPEFRVFLQDLRKQSGGVLAVWDAPLTGPADWNLSAEADSNFTTRRIERILRRMASLDRFVQEDGAPTFPKTLPYASCCHWTATRSLIGLPRVGPYDMPSGLPFELLYADFQIKSEGAYVIETHPSIAIWAWIGNFEEYKGSPRAETKKQRKYLLDRLVACWEVQGLQTPILEHIAERKNAFVDDDDIFDALVACVLGVFYADACLEFSGAVEKVRVFGDLRDGAMLLPKTTRMEDAFGKAEKSLKNQKKSRSQTPS